MQTRFHQTILESLSKVKFGTQKMEWNEHFDQLILFSSWDDETLCSNSMELAILRLLIQLFLSYSQYLLRLHSKNTDFLSNTIYIFFY